MDKLPYQLVLDFSISSKWWFQIHGAVKPERLFAFKDSPFT